MLGLQSIGGAGIVSGAIGTPHTRDIITGGALCPDTKLSIALSTLIDAVMDRGFLVNRYVYIGYGRAVAQLSVVDPTAILGHLAVSRDANRRIVSGIIVDVNGGLIFLFLGRGILIRRGNFERKSTVIGRASGRNFRQRKLRQSGSLPLPKARVH